MPQAKKPDRLRYAANLAAVGALLCIALTWALRRAAGLTLRLLHAGATLANPVGVPEWVMGLWTVMLAGAGALAAFLWLCRTTAPCGFCCPAFWASAWC